MGCCFRQPSIKTSTGKPVTRPTSLVRQPTRPGTTGTASNGTPSGKPITRTI